MNHVVPTVYQKLLDAADAVDRLHSSRTAWFWRGLEDRALGMSSSHRGRYQAMSMLINKVGVREILEEKEEEESGGDPSRRGRGPARAEGLLAQLLDAIQDREVASSSSALIVLILRTLIREHAHDLNLPNAAAAAATAVRALWIEEVSGRLCAQDSSLRFNIADYLLPELLKVDPDAAPCLIDIIRRRPRLDDSSTSRDRVTWALLNVALQARLLGYVGGEIAEEEEELGQVREDRITLKELDSAAVSADDDIRLCALTTLTASLKTSAPFSPGERAVLRRCLRVSLKEARTEHRSRVVRAVKGLVLRLTEHARCVSRDLLRLDSAKAKRKTAAEADTAEHGRERLERSVRESHELMRWLCDSLIGDNLYPGTSFDREVTSLDVLRCIFESTVATAATAQGPHSLLRVFTESAAVVRTLLSILLSSWDRSRRLAADLLLKLHKPLPGFETVAAAQQLLDWGLRLAGKAKLRESDAGAILVRNVFVIYCAHLGWTLHFPSVRDRDGADLVEHISNESQRACGLFVLQLCGLIHARLTRLEKLFEDMNVRAVLASGGGGGGRIDQAVDSSGGEGSIQSEESVIPYCHGLLLALRYCLQAAKNTGHLSGELQLWASLAEIVFRASMKALSVAMTVVAESASDVPFAPLHSENISGGGGGGGSRGPVNTSTGYGGDSASHGHGHGRAEEDNTDMAASYINANSVMDSDWSSSAEAIQRAVIAAWLLVKESSALLAFLVEASPSPSSSPSVAPNLLGEEAIALAGHTLLDSLGRLKHMGAIAETHSSLQSIATALLR